jgi:hypothetical protein
MNFRLYNIIKQKLYTDFKDVEIIFHEGSFWFLDLKKFIWFLEIGLDKCSMWWNTSLLIHYQDLFSISTYDFISVLSDWVIEFVDNRKILTTNSSISLNHEVNIDVIHPNPYGMKNVITDIFMNHIVDVDHKIKIIKSGYYKLSSN